ncbi:MAG: glycosyltransferase [Pyrinomonadaceae bacterium]|nr:glycosyltransferase [Sphingobacteriaceae bacterium]
MILPLLSKYKNNFINRGVTIPLSKTPYRKNGLITELPPAPANKSGWPWTEQTDPQIYNEIVTWPKLTIVTPSYNQGNFLEETIRSVLLQNYPNLEYIIMDGGSNDETKEILEKYSPWLSYWQSEQDNGQGHAINLGFSLASGDFYGWINSDDYYLKDVFSIVINKFLKTKSAFVYGYGFNYHVKENLFELIKILPFLDFFIKIPGLVQPSTFWSALIHKPIWEELYCSIDFELWLRLVKGNKRSFIKEALSVANVHENAKTSDPKMKIKWDEDEKIIWSANGHGAVPHWDKINFINKIRYKAYKLLRLI